jgi:predicted regulator of Ras-like GTPase activity (Roadblock/LC7/MglB family)
MPRRDWGYLLDQFCQRVHGVSDALAVSGDGLAIAASRDLTTANADQLSAITSGLSSLSTGAADLLDRGGVEQVVVEMTGGYLVVMAIGDGSILTVQAAKDCDLGQVGYEMATMISQVGATLTLDARQAQQA